MKSKVKVIFLFWTNGLSTSHHILIVHCASSKDSFSADHSSSLHSGAFTWLRFSASLKVLVWARRCQIYLSAPCGGCLCLQFPNAANLCESSLKVFQCHKPKILIQMNTWIIISINCCHAKMWVSGWLWGGLPFYVAPINSSLRLLAGHHRPELSLFFSSEEDDEDCKYEHVTSFRRPDHRPECSPDPFTSYLSTHTRVWTLKVRLKL